MAIVTHKKQSILITGAAAGIGRCLSQELIGPYNLILIDKNRKGGEKLAHQLNKIGVADFYCCDLNHTKSFSTLLRKIKKKHKSLYGIINNAGIFLHQDLHKLSLQQWEQILRVNLTSIFLTAQFLSPLLKKNSGAIINVSSTRALMSEPHSESYAASKGGILALTHALAISLGPEITVNCISPGWIETRNWPALNKSPIPFKHSKKDKLQHPVGRVGNPIEIAELVKFLLSKKTGFMTGTNIVVDGGMSKKMIYS